MSSSTTNTAFVDRFEGGMNLYNDKTNENEKYKNDGVCPRKIDDVHTRPPKHAG